MLSGQVVPANRELRIGVIGLGHVGLPTALGLAELGWEVIGADDNREKAALIASGDTPFYEPGAADILRKHLAGGGFRVAPDVPAMVAEADVLFVCVGTPQREDGSADLSQVDQVARVIARHLNGFKLIVEKSTTPVRTAEQIKRTIRRYTNGPHDFEVAVNPEFLREGSAVRDFLHPDRIVLGVESPRGSDLLLRIYRPLLDRLAAEGGAGPPERRVLTTDLHTAEIIKHAANAFLATKISFINMVADVCDALGADVTEVARGLALDGRIGPANLEAGVGYGGYCLPKDVQAFAKIGEDHGVDVTLLKAVDRINRQRVDRVLEKVRRALWVVREKTIAVLGLAFKPLTDDVREAPSLKVVEALLAEGAVLRLHDPQAMPSARAIFPEDPKRIAYCASPYEAAAGADAVVVLTEWNEYRELDLARVREVMSLPTLIDGRNVLDPAEARALGFEYFSMGRP